MRRLGSAALEPLPLVSLIATSLSLRLVFEVNMIGYYLMAMAVSLVMLDVIRGRISLLLVGWLGLVFLAFYPPWEFDPMSYGLPPWMWQILILGSGVVLAAGPLMSAALAGRQMRSFDLDTAGLSVLPHPQTELTAPLVGEDG